MRRLVWCLLFKVVALLPSWSAEIVLRNGFVLQAECYELGQDRIRLHRGEGWIELPLAEIAEVIPAEEASSSLRCAWQPVSGGDSVRPEEQQRLWLEELIRWAAQAQGLPVAFVRSVAEVESGLRPQAVSPKGARGLFQLMPETARELGVNPDDPWQNAFGGALLLRRLLLRYRGRVFAALAAYNAGPGRVKQYGGLPPFRETLDYIERVVRRYWELEAGEKIAKPSHRQ